MRTHRRTTPRIEPLEGRTLFALTVQIDYTYDEAGFFADPARRATLQAAADAAVSRFGDSLAAIVPVGSNTWTAILDDPGGSGSDNIELPNLTIPADTLVVYAGARQMGSLGIGGPGGFSSSGTTQWNELVAARGQANARGNGATDFGPFGGSITFDTQPANDWYFGLDEAGIAGQSDFYSVALHEMTHLLGFGTSDAWESRASANMFTGAASVAQYDGAGNVPLSGDGAHWASATLDGGAEAAMDPDLTTGQRKTLTALDLAGMDDIGWSIPLAAALGSAGAVTAAGAANTSFTVSYTHYTDIDAASLGTGDLIVTGPNGFNAPASLESLTDNGDTVVGTYSIGAPGGTFDGADSGSYSVAMAGQAVGDAFGNFARAGALGSFVVDIDSPPAASSFAAQNVTQIGGATHTVDVAYADNSGIAADGIDAADLVVTRNGDGLALTVVAANPADAGNGSPKAVAYILAAPGGTWDAADNGTYAVSLAAGQVRDVNGTFAPAATLGTFDVTVGAVPFAAGSNAIFTDASGDTVTIALKGPGAGQLLFDDAGNADPSGLTLNGTTTASTLTITATGGGTTFDGITINGDLRSLTGKAVDLAGVMTVTGSVPKLLLRNASGTIALNGAAGGGAVTIALAAARDLSVSAAPGVKSLKVAADWLDTDATPDEIATPVLSTLSIRGALQAGVSAGTIGKITAGGALTGSEIRATDGIGSVTVASASGSLIFAGVKPGVASLPDGLDDFVNPAASIRSVLLRGKPSPFADTRIAAPFVGKATLGTASIGADTAPPFGLAADRITSVSGATSVRGPYRLARLQEAGTGTALIDFAIVVL